MPHQISPFVPVWPPQVGPRPADLYQRYLGLGHRFVARTLPDRWPHPVARHLLVGNHLVDPMTRHLLHYRSQTHHFAQTVRLVGFALLPPAPPLAIGPLVDRAVTE